MTEWDDLGRGLVAGMLQQRVSDSGSIGRRVSVGMMVGGGLAAVGFGGFMRGLGITFVLVGLIIVLVNALIRTMALSAIGGFATPTSIVEKRAVINRTMEQADLPTGPISVIRFLYRLRNGVTSEQRRLERVMDDLRDDLAASEDEIQADPQLDPASMPELPEPVRRA